jgi:putative transposase
MLITDKGPEFVGRLLDAWGMPPYTAGFYRPGRANQNAYIESFDGRFRDECLNGHWFLSVA